MITENYGPETEIDTKEVYSIDEIRRRVSRVAKKHNLKAVYLFGSYA